MNCESCRFFLALDEESNDGDGYIYGAAVTFWDSENERSESSKHGTCVRIIHGNKDSRNESAIHEPAVVTDGSGYAAALRVLPSFGCVLWEEKKKT